MGRSFVRHWQGDVMRRRGHIVPLVARHARCDRHPGVVLGAIQWTCTTTLHEHEVREAEETQGGDQSAHSVNVT